MKMSRKFAFALVCAAFTILVVTVLAVINGKEWVVVYTGGMLGVLSTFLPPMKRFTDRMVENFKKAAMIAYNEHVMEEARRAIRGVNGGRHI